MREDKNFKLLIAAGGTGGHIFPALAVAKEVMGMGKKVAWLGTKKGLEAKIIPKEDIKLNYIWVWGVRGKGGLIKLLAPFRVILAILQSMIIIIKFKPSVVLGLGGFVSGPAGIAAWLLRVPLVIHEQNSIAGLTNKILARFATAVLQGFPHSFKNVPNAIFTGNPVRKEILTKTNNIVVDPNNLKILIIGGSRGALALNKVIPGAITKSNCAPNISVWHQTGDAMDNTVPVDAYKGVKSAKIEPFITDMAAAYTWADLVICRAGALTIAELAIAGVASILVPFPQAVDDHQTYNAKYLSDSNAAILLPQAQFNEESLGEILLDLYNKPSKIQTMAQNIKALAMPDALNKVVAALCSI
jgi:UDP-N-acetylglucosamine--N-acetylmuramyl-(pentapeptide) pyrophosphoryl-undecaprenol N-acetylglucosamine transferase